jgi:tRNA 2-thiouridine synthesizing protein A
MAIRPPRKDRRGMPTLEIAQVVDARGLSCPLPIVRTAQAVKTIPSGALLEVLATDAGSVKDVAAWSKATGNPIVEASVEAGVYRFVLRRK